jgi:virginiamycin B lyase
MPTLAQLWTRLTLIALAAVTIHSAALAGGVRRPERARAGLTWTELPGAATAIAASVDGSLWGLSTLPAGQADKHVIHLVGNTWTTVSGYADRISTAPDGAPYVVSSSGGVYSYRNGSWTPVNNSQQLASTATAGADSGIYFLSRTAGSVTGNFTVWRKPWGATGLIQLPGAGTQIAASFDTSTYTVPGVGALAPYGYFLLQSSGVITYYSPQGTQAVQFPVSASAIAPVLGGFYALSYPRTAAGETVYYFDYASGTTTVEPGRYVALSAYGSVGTSPHLFALDSQNHVWSTPITPTSQPVEISEYPILPSNVDNVALGVAPGPGGVWFAVSNGESPGLNEVGLMAAPGHITYFPVPSNGFNPLNGGVVEGSDGAMWFTCDGSILRVTSAGSFTNYLVPGPNGYPAHITSIPGSSLWFAEADVPTVGDITTSGTITRYSLDQTLSGHALNGIAYGSDGALWLAATASEVDGPYIVRLLTDGTSSLFSLAANFGNTGYPGDITSGPDGALWFTDSTTAAIGRITTSGSISSFKLSKVNPTDLTTGSDGALWFTNLNSLSSTSGLVGRLTTSGTATYYPIPNYVNEPLDGRYENDVAFEIKGGSDGAIYFVEYNKIGRIVLGTRN